MLTKTDEQQLKLSTQFDELLKLMNIYYLPNAQELPFEHHVDQIKPYHDQGEQRANKTQENISHS